MTSRIARETSYQLQPALLSGLYSLDKASSKSLPPLLVHLVKLRVSQLNGCAFCLQMHSTEARKDGWTSCRPGRKRRSCLVPQNRPRSAGRKN